VNGELRPIHWNSDGYVHVYYPEHPFHNASRCVPEHRLVMEKHLGRYLTTDEIVHHINGIRDDNRIENLQLINKNTERHFTKFYLAKEITKLQEENVRLVAENAYLRNELERHCHAAISA
jgi:hypothetical protein